MQVKKITAKLRDMVRISLMEDGNERTWYNNIEIPEEIKVLEMKDFHFNTLTDGKIEFAIYFEPGTLPKVFPEKRERKRRAEKEQVTATDSQPALPEAPKASLVVKSVEAPESAAQPKPPEAPIPKAEPVKAPATPIGAAKTANPAITKDKPKDSPKSATLPTTAIKAGAKPAEKKPETK